MEAVPKVREAIKLIEADGWREVRTKGSHRQFKHPTKPGYEHGLKRDLLTRGITAKEMGSDVADFTGPINTLIGLVSAGTGIPQRVLMGSEQGKLAAKQDRGNRDNRVSDRSVRDARTSPS